MSCVASVTFPIRTAEARIRHEQEAITAAEERFGIIRLNPAKGVRIVERLTIMPVTKETIEEQDQVEIFRQQVDDGLYKIWPTKPIEPGEYAVVEYTEGKVNVQVWDFAYDPNAKQAMDSAAAKP